MSEVDVQLSDCKLHGMDRLIPSEIQMILRNEFSRRCRSNSRYSIRAFSKHLGLDSSSLSKILSGKRKVSKRHVDLLNQKIGSLISIHSQPQFTLLDYDAFAVISDWYHFAILDLTYLKSFKSDFNWIAKQLSISATDAENAVERLIRLKLLEKKNRKFRKTQNFLTNYSEGVTSAAHKEYQHQVIQKAREAIDLCSQDRKDITSITIPANSKKLGEAKAKIRAFRRELCAFMEVGEKDSVYHFCLQLYPVTISKEKS